MEKKNSKIISVILPAAGSGSRMASSIPKPFMLLAGKPVIFYTLQQLGKLPHLAEIILVLGLQHLAEMEQKYGSSLRDFGVSQIIAGGQSRAESVKLGIDALQLPCSLIAVHDAVRPFPSAVLLANLCQAAEEGGGALPVLPVSDTIKRVINYKIKETIARQELFTVQTPQVFKREILEAAYQNANSLGAEITDDAGLVEALGQQLSAVRGEVFNLKLTTQIDLLLATALLSANMVNLD